MLQKLSLLHPLPDAINGLFPWFLPFKILVRWGEKERREFALFAPCRGCVIDHGEKGTLIDSRV